MPASRRMRPVVGMRNPGPHGMREMSGVTNPWLTSSRSSPPAFSRFASSIDSSTVTPPSVQSVTDSRAVSGRRSGHTARTAAKVSVRNRTRLSKLPP